MGEREMALSTRIWPRSMRLAISTSPSRVSSGTVPISRRYMRTGSLVFSSVPGRQVELDVLALFQLEFLVAGKLGRVQQIDALGADGGDQIVQIVGRADLIRQHVVHVAVGEIALLLAGLDQAVNVVFEFVVNRQIIPALFGASAMPPVRIQRRALVLGPIAALRRCTCASRRTQASRERQPLAGLHTAAGTVSRRAQKRFPVRKSSRMQTHVRAPLKRFNLLGTGWQRFRFRLGRPRAAAHVWGKGARILTEINRLPQSTLPAPAKFGGNSAPCYELLADRAGADLPSRPLLLLCI